MDSTISTVALTIIGGAFTLVIGNMLDKGFLEPALELKREIGKITYSLIFYANRRYSSPPEIQEETRVVIRTHAARLNELVQTITAYWAWRFILQLPSKVNVLEASRCLIGHSNFPEKPDGVKYDRADEIRGLLKITSKN